MCLLSQHLLQLELDDDDALVIQTHNDDEMGLPNYSQADAVICRIETETGPSWCYQTLLFVNETIKVMHQLHGTLTDVVNAARYQFGRQLDCCELLGVSYHSKDFPRHLIPTSN